jgi:hypothetical protein
MSGEFKVIVRGEDREAVWRAYKALENANFSVGGPPPSGPTDEPVYDEPIYHEVHVEGVRANSADSARERVREKLPRPDGDYDIQVIPVDEG